MESKVRTNPNANKAPVTNATTAFQQRQASNSSGGSPTKDGSKPGAPGNGPPQPEAKQYDVTMKLGGIAYTDVQVAQFIRKLNESKLLKDVNLVITDQLDKDGEQLRKFQIESTLDPNAEMIPADSNNKTLAVELKTPAAKKK